MSPSCKQPAYKSYLHGISQSAYCVEDKMPERNTDWGKPERKSYHCLELQQVSFSSRQRFCRDKHMSVATKIRLLSRQKPVCLSRQKTKVRLSRQKFCPILNTSFVATKVRFSATNTCLSRLCSSRQAYFCRDKNGTCGSPRQ